MPERRVAIVTCWPPPASRDDVVLAEAFAALGADARIVPWSEPRDWSAFDAAVIRTTWDWHLRSREFEAWIERAAGATRLFNAPELLRWGLDKRYLFDLAGAGVPIVPSVLVRDRTVPAPSAIGLRAVIKPTIGATSYRTRVVDTSDTGGWSGAIAEAMAGGPALVQPFLDSIHSAGELSVVFIDGSFTHAVRKRPAPGDFRVQKEFHGSAALDTPDGAERAVAEACRRALPGVPSLLRVDLVRLDDGRPVVIECEVVEPELFLDLAPEAASELARTVLRDAH